MIQLKRILLPTDFSEYSAEASKYACALVEQFDSELHLFHVLEVHASTTPVFGGGLALTPPVEESREAAENELARLLGPEWHVQDQVAHRRDDDAPALAEHTSQEIGEEQQG